MFIYFVDKYLVLAPTGNFYATPEHCSPTGLEARDYGRQLSFLVLVIFGTGRYGIFANFTNKNGQKAKKI